MSGDNNGYQHDPGHAGGSDDPVQSPWSIRPGAPAYQGEQGAYPDPQQAGYESQTPYRPAPPPAPPAPAASPRASGSRRAGSRASNSRRAGAAATGGEPDWNALADRESRRRRRSKKTRVTAIGAALAVLAAGAVTWFLLSDDSSDKPADKTGPVAGGTTTPEPFRPTFKPAPTVPPPPGGAAVLADPALDTAPFTPQDLFPSPQLTVNGRTYTVAAKKLDNTCADAGNPELGKILRARQCVQVIRLTALSPEGTAATVAVGSFANPAEAKAAADEGNTNRGAALISLPGGPVPILCPPPTPDKPAVVCARQTNSLGRYGLFLIGGYPGPDNRIDPAKGDPKVDQIGTDLDQAVREALSARGEKRSQAIYDQAKAEAEKKMQQTG